MVLNGDEIKAKGLIESADQAGFRNSSYDLRIGKMLSPGTDDQDLDKFVLEPQGIVEVVSAERVKLPQDVVGYAMVKTTLCNDGIFAINIGIVDPGYSGMLSSTLVNLGKKSYPLVAGQVFLRLVFHELKAKASPETLPMADATYMAQKRSKVKERFSATFLDIPGTVQRLSKPIVEDLFGKWKMTLFWWIPLAAVGFAFLSFWVNWGATWSARNALLDKTTLRTELRNEMRQPEDNERDKKIAELQRQLEDMSRRLDTFQAGGRGVIPKQPSTGR